MLVQREIDQKQLLAMPLTQNSIASYPLLKNTEPNTPLESIQSALSAHAAVILDDDSKVILYEKNSTAMLPMASTTKLMTALTALDHFKLNDQLTVKTASAAGSVVGFTKGEVVSFEDLLYGMLLPSGNDAAITIAENYPGGTVWFVAKMNEKAAQYHLGHTHFADPAGLNDEANGNFTTARDLANLASIAIKNPTIAKIVATKQKLIADVTGKIRYDVSNLNKLLGEEGIIGVKTGFTDKAGGVLTTAKIENGHLLILVVMNSQDRFSDTQRLLSLVHGNIAYTTFDPFVSHFSPKN